MSDVAEKLSRLRKLLRGFTGPSAEAEVLKILGESDSTELNELVRHLNLGILISSLDDHLFGPDNRKALFELLCVDRVGELSVGSCASLIDALQRGPTGKQRERAIRDLFLATHGEDLTTLKNRVDAGSDYHDLQQLLFTDIDEVGMREVILDHIRREAGPRGAALKVLSDVDDTIYASLHDKRYPPRTRYPGVVKLYDELDRGASETADRFGDVVFLTARPKVRTGWIEGVTQSTLRHLGFFGVTVLSGDFFHLVGDEIAEKKRENFEQYRSLFPEYSFVFIGDSGQKDAEFGEGILKDFPDEVRAVLIHDVCPDSERRSGVHYFDTYVGAAVVARELGLISAAGLGRVVVRAQEEFASITFPDAETRAAQQKALQADIRRASD